MISYLPAGEVILTQWNIIEIIQTGEQHFVGYSQLDQLGRVSTPILKFDDESGVGETRSGSQYKVIGKPGRLHSDARYVLERVCPIELIAYRFRYPIAS
jgi:hypothetical protein